MKCGICGSDDTVDTVQMVEHGNTQCKACGALKVVGFSWAPQQQGFSVAEPENPADSPLVARMELLEDWKRKYFPGNWSPSPLQRRGLSRLEFPEAEPDQPVVNGVHEFKGCLYFATDKGVFFTRDGETVEPLPFPKDRQ